MRQTTRKYIVMLLYHYNIVIENDNWTLQKATKSIRWRVSILRTLRGKFYFFSECEFDRAPAITLFQTAENIITAFGRGRSSS